MAKKRNIKKIKKPANRTGLILLAILAFVFSIFTYFIFLRPATKFESEETIFLIPTKKTEKKLVQTLLKENLHTVNYTTFLALADWFGYWDKIKPGKYIIGKNASVFEIFRKLYGGQQSPIKITINKFRTKKDLSKFIGNKFEFLSGDLYRFITNIDSLESLLVNPENMMTLIIPNTYEIYWTSSPREFMERMKKESNIFWNRNRVTKAKELGFSKEDIYIIASIVEEETNNNAEKSKMASVYINRLNKGMALGADPTIKFAVGDFTIKRVMLTHINSSSSSLYNTYKHKGLPPGPICTPSILSIDAVLNGEKTSYLYFCAKSDFSGSHSFATTAEEHFENARRYRKALDSLRIH